MVWDEEQITEEAEQPGDIVADILAATNFPPPSKSKQFWKPRIMAALQAILYGIASSAIWELIFDLASHMNPAEQEEAYMQIRTKTWEELTQRNIPEELEKIVGSKELADSLFDSLFDISLHRTN